jgi:ferritin-like metal-binding protein YciE
MASSLCSRNCLVGLSIWNAEGASFPSNPVSTARREPLGGRPLRQASEVLTVDHKRVEENFMAWLRNAHAMEEQAVTMLTALAGRTGDYPEVKARIEQHLGETRKQAEALEACIKRRGGDTSTLKDMAGKVIAFGQGMSGMFVDDEIVKGAMASYTFEHMEVAAYRVLIATAEAVGDPQTKAVCERILEEELSMASDLEGHLPNLTRKYLSRSNT